MYLEDTDLSWRVRLAGYRCRLAARSVVAHDYQFRLTATKTECVERNRYLMLAKNLSFRSLIVLIPIMLFVLFPFYWVIITSFKTTPQIFERQSIFSTICLTTPRSRSTSRRLLPRRTSFFDLLPLSPTASSSK